MSAPRVAVVTGAGHGIGRAVALRLASTYQVVAFDSAPESCRANLPAEIKVVGCDVTDENSVVKAFDEVRRTVGPTAALVNNVGASLHEKRLHEITKENWEHTFRLNVLSAFLCTREAVRDMMSENWGRVVCVSAVAGRTSTLFGGADFTAAKASLHGFVRQCAVELASHGITVNCVAPGLTLSERVASAWLARTQDERDRLVAHIPMRRPSTVEEQAAPIAFLLSDDAAYISGACLDVNGAMFVP